MALGRCHMVSAVRAGLSRLPFVVLLVLAIMALSFVFMMLCRYEQNRRNAGGAGSPQSSAVAYGEELPATGRFTKSITYTCIDAPGRETVSPVVWDDGWFFGDMRTYNHDLAKASSVLAALAYSESSHYQESYQTPPYMENALAELGFDEVSTASYEYRSEVMDQMLNLVTQREDTVAYTLARKRVTGADGSTRSVILVSVRGSYGSEWLSNLKIEGVSPEGEAALSEDQETRYDHSGYVEAASEVSQAVAPWVRESHRRGDQVTLLLVGHSRGGAIANLVAAQADDELAALAEGSQPQDGLELAAGDAVAGYTFASPGCTTSAHAHAARYGNIFNIANPADLMPALPLASWGYARYGVDMNLPAMGEEGFDTQFASMSSAYTELTGEEDPYDPEAAQAVRSVVGEVGAEVGSVDELVTPGGIAAVAQACARHIDPTRILCGHYPSVYISWMYTIEADDLTLR